MEDEIPPVLDDIDAVYEGELSDSVPPIDETVMAVQTTAGASEHVETQGIIAHSDHYEDEEDEPVRIKKVVEGAPKWVVTFGDLMSLLLTFFVLLLSFSSMDPVRFKIVRGSLDRALGMQTKVQASSTPRATKALGKTYNRRDFSRQIESILKLALRDTFPPGQEPGRIEKVQDIRGEVVRFVAYDLFLPGTEELAPKAKLVFRAMADTLIRGRSRLEIRGLATEAFSTDTRRRGKQRSRGVMKAAVAGRRSVIACNAVRNQRKREIQSRHVLPAVSPGRRKAPPPGVVNLTEFVFLAPDGALETGEER